LKKTETTPSKKRLLLEKNLKAVVKNVEMRKTPLRIAELWVYGSFIRPKEEPGDVDLEVFTRPDEELDEKMRLIQDFLHFDSRRQLKETAWAEAKQGRVDALVEALDREFGHDERHRLWLETSRASWLYLARNMGVEHEHRRPQDHQDRPAREVEDDSHRTDRRDQTNRPEGRDAQREASQATLELGLEGCGCQSPADARGGTRSR
jgi:predicted nucleotidyltransferase